MGGKGLGDVHCCVLLLDRTAWARGAATHSAAPEPLLQWHGMHVDWQGRVGREDQIPCFNFLFSHDGHFGLGTGGSRGWEGGLPGLCLKGRGAIREIPERLQSGHRGCEAVGGRLLAVGNAVGAGVGVQGCLWGRVRAGVLGGGRGDPPPFKRFPGLPPPSSYGVWPF